MEGGLGVKLELQTRTTMSNPPTKDQLTISALLKRKFPKADGPAYAFNKAHAHKVGLSEVMFGRYYNGDLEPNSRLTILLLKAMGELAHHKPD